MNKIKSIKRINFIFIIFLILFSILLFNNKTIEKEQTTKNSTKALDQEGENYRLVTSADNVQVPVPKGYVASGVTGENYVSPQYQHTTITYKVSSTPTELTWSSPEGEQYPWTQDSNGIWISGNQGIQNSTSTIESEEFDYIKGTTLTIKYTYSSQTWDKLYIYIISITKNVTQPVIEISGNTSASFDYTTSNYTYTMNDWATGRYKIKAVYKKGNLGNEGQDRGYIKTSTYYKADENGETIEVDQKTKIHDGGLVIYQLTDEEIETDPNGTSVIINDTNKDEAQRTRNQYVWVPVSNTEDIVRTKEKNNGIMQFGQIYSFGTSSIIKNTNLDVFSPIEPSLVENTDKRKYYLQKYSNIDKKVDYLNNMQEEFTRIIKSVNKYKGYYIGRYETGDDYKHSESKGDFTTPRVVRYNDNIAYVRWYNSYKDLKRLSGKTDEYVETGMIYDCLWDITLKWFNDTDTRSYKEIRDSGAWGNYSNNRKTAPLGGLISVKAGAIETITFNGETYNDNPTSSNNIFDMAGNVFEWTMSSSSSDRRKMRGGSAYYYSNNTPAYNFSTFTPTISNNGSVRFGVRSMLIIK